MSRPIRDRKTIRDLPGRLPRQRCGAVKSDGQRCNNYPREHGWCGIHKDPSKRGRRTDRRRVAGYVTDEEHAAFLEAARDAGVSVDALVGRLVREFLGLG